MDTAFNLDDNNRANFVRLLLQSLGCTYICLWKYNPSANYLFFLDGLYQEESNTQLPSSSSGSLARRLFDEYRQSIILGLDQNNQVPGLAFKNSSSYLELKDLELRGLASNETQRRFYLEAGIKTAVFMGCRTGEIELGLSNIIPQINMKMELTSWFPQDFPSQSSQLSTNQDIASQTQIVEHNINPIRPPTDNQNPLAASSSSSSLRSLSMDNSPEYSSLLFSINPTTTPPASSHKNIISPELSQQELLLINPNNPMLQPISSSPLLMPHQQAIQAFARLRNVQFPSADTEDAAMTKAILAVLTSSSPHPHQQHDHLTNPKSSAFQSYSTSTSTATTTTTTTTSTSTSTSSPSVTALDHQRFSLKKSLFKRSVSFFRSLNYMRNRQRLQQAAAAAAATTCRPTTSTQLHHMISERKRREKLNESFQSLRSLLPPGTKKDKASVLNTTTEHLNSLKAQVEELSRRNKELEAQVLSPGSAAIGTTEAKNGRNLTITDASSTSDDPHQRVDVRVRHVSESTSEEAGIVDLQVILRTAVQFEDLVLRILEFLKRDENVSLMSMEANTRLIESTSTSLNRVTLRLRIEGNEWDESAFQEAVRRVVADMAQ